MENLSKFGEALVDCLPKMDIPGCLPIEIFHQILKYLTPDDLHNVQDCCEKWRRMMKPFWKLKCKMECYYETEDDLNSKCYRKYIQQFSRWEGMYRYNKKLEDNWITEKCTEVVKAMEELVGFKLQYFSGDVIIATLGFKEVVIIDSTTAMIEKRFNLTFPTGVIVNSIFAVQKVENNLIAVVGTETSSEDEKILFVTVWNIETEELLQNEQMETIEGAIDKVLIYKNLITVLSHYDEVYIYNIEKKAIDYRQSDVNYVCVDGDKIAMGNEEECTVVVLNLDFSEVMNINCCGDETELVYIYMQGKYLVNICRSMDYIGHTACVWNIEKKSKLYQLKKNFVNFIEMYSRENTLYYMTSDLENGTFIYKLCRLDTGVCILNHGSGSHSTTKSFVLTLDTDNDNLLKLWSIKTGKLITSLKLSPSSPYLKILERKDSDQITKSKVVFVPYDTEKTDWSLNLVDFEANMNL